MSSIIRHFSKTLIAVTLILLNVASAGEPLRYLSESEFKALAAKLAPKVNLFAEVWKQDSKAEFYGGTTRDYLYWLKGQFKNAKSEKESLAIVKKLENLPSIDLNDFLVDESDIDVIGDKTIHLDPRRFGTRKVDNRGPEIFDPAHPMGRNELDQGHLPAEKIRLSKDGLVPPKHFGDGAKEIYEGKLTAHFTSPKDFARSYYARQKLNHPILLAMRYLRLQAVDYFQNYGQGLPDRTLLLGSINPASGKKVREIIESAIQTRELSDYVSNEKFLGWLNGSIHKAFRSHSNPDAAMELMKEFQVPELVDRYEGIKTLNQYLFTQKKDAAKIAQNLREFGVDPKKTFLNVSKEFPDGKIYHATRDPVAFRNILIQGIKESEHGSAGSGLYGVNINDQSQAEEKYGAHQRLVSLEVSPNARIVNIHKEPGKSLWERFKQRFPYGKDLHSRFAEAFGIDILNYPHDFNAYVVKNGAVLDNPKGVHLQVVTFSKAFDQIEKIRTFEDLKSSIIAIGTNPFSEREQDALISELERTGKLRLITQGKSYARTFSRFTSIPVSLILKRRIFEIWQASPEFEKVGFTAADYVKALQDPTDLRGYPDTHLRLLEKVSEDFARLTDADRKRFGKSFLSTQNERPVTWNAEIVLAAIESGKNPGSFQMELLKFLGANRLKTQAHLGIHQVFFDLAQKNQERLSEKVYQAMARWISDYTRENGPNWTMLERWFSLPLSPKYDTVLPYLLEKNVLTIPLAENVFKHPHWSSHPRAKKTLAEAERLKPVREALSTLDGQHDSPYSTNKKMLQTVGLHLFGDEDGRKSIAPKYALGLFESLDPSTHDAALVQSVMEGLASPTDLSDAIKILFQKRGSDRWEPILDELFEERLSNRKTVAGLSEIWRLLPQSFKTTEHAKGIAELVKSSEEDTLAFVKNILADPNTPNRGELLKTLSRDLGKTCSDEGCLKILFEKVLSQPFVSDHLETAREIIERFNGRWTHKDELIKLFVRNVLPQAHGKALIPSLSKIIENSYPEELEAVIRTVVKNGDLKDSPALASRIVSEAMSGELESVDRLTRDVFSKPWSSGWEQVLRDYLKKQAGRGKLDDAFAEAVATKILTLPHTRGWSDAKADLLRLSRAAMRGKLTDIVSVPDQKRSCVLTETISRINRVKGIRR